MRGDKRLIQLIVSIILYFVIFFGIAFILNMLLRKTWLMAFLYPFVMLYVLSDNTFGTYFTKPAAAFGNIQQTISMFNMIDMIVLLSGLAGAIVSGIVIKMLRKTGYQMF